MTQLNVKPEYRQCLRKRFHAKKPQAQAEADRIREERGDPVRPYKCPFCPGYHVGKVPLRERGRTAS